MAVDELTLAAARARDAADPLASFRREFALPADERGEPLVYLCGHSLGPMPVAARELVLEELEDWSRLGVRGHEAARRPWIGYAELLQPGLEGLTGARPGEVVAMNSLTVNLHLMLASFYRPVGRRTKILIESGAFPSDRHAVASQIAWHGLDSRAELIELVPQSGSELIETAAIEALLASRGEQIALVLWPAVQYLTGQSFDVAAVAGAAHRAGSIAGFDLAHAIGNVPLALHAAGADFAIWCSYKYLNAGPGAIGGCFIHERHGMDRGAPRLAGWWGHDPATRFDMRPEFRPAPGAAGWQVSNPPILSAAPLIPSLALFESAGIARLRAKSEALTAFLEALLEPLPLEILTPRNPAARGSQLSLRLPARARSAGHRGTGGGGTGREATGQVPSGRALIQRLSAEGIVCDWREPDILRVAPAPLYNGFVDVFRFAQRLAVALRAGR
ncbi:MAG: kynureninase [Steroidobacteraceae bacterium]